MVFSEVCHHITYALNSVAYCLEHSSITLVVLNSNSPAVRYSAFHVDGIYI